MNQIRQSGLYLAGRIVPACIGLAGVALYTRLLDPETIGEFALIVSVTFLASSTSYTWLRIAALRKVAGCADDDLPGLFATISILFCGTSLLISPIVAFSLHLYKPALPLSSVILAASAVVASGWHELNSSLLQARLQVRSWSLLNLARAVVGVAVSTVCILIGWKTNALLVGFVLGNLTAILFVRMWSPALHGFFDGKIARGCFQFGWPQSASAAQAYAAPVGQRWILDAGVGSAGLGIFAVAQDFGSLTLASLIGSASLAGIPLAFRAKDRGDEAALNTQLKANARLIFAVALPATVVLCTLAAPISHWVFGSRFWEGAPTILTIAAVSAFAGNMRTYYFDQAFELAMQTRAQAVISLIGTIVLIGGCVLLVPRYAAVGAAVAALVGSLTCLSLSVWWGARVLLMPIPLRDWFKTALATTGMALALIVAPWGSSLIGLASELAAGCILYLMLSTVTRPRLFAPISYIASQHWGNK